MFVLPLLPLPATLLLHAHARVSVEAHGKLEEATRHVRHTKPTAGKSQGKQQDTRAHRWVPHLLMLVLPPFHPLFTLLRKQDPRISDCC